MTCRRQNFEIGSLWNDHIPVTANQNWCIQSNPDRGTETLRKTAISTVRAAFEAGWYEVQCSAVQWDFYHADFHRLSSAFSWQICRLHQDEHVGTSGTVWRFEGGDWCTDPRHRVGCWRHNRIIYQRASFWMGEKSRFVWPVPATSQTASIVDRVAVMLIAVRRNTRRGLPQ